MKSSPEKKMSKKKKIIHTSIVIVSLIAILVLSYFIMVWTGLWNYINSVDKIRQLILTLGFWGRLAFVLIQFLQVTFLPIPSAVSTLAGVLVYGPLQAALLSLSGILLGSVFAFWLGRKFGRKLVSYMVGEESCKKWTKFLTNGKYSFVVMMILPIFPDDILCLVAGLTNMTWSFFVVTNLVSRTIGIFLTCYLGSGTIVPYKGWGLAVWAGILVLVGVVLYLSFKYRENIENFIKNKVTKNIVTNIEAGEEKIKTKFDKIKNKKEKIKKEKENKDKNNKKC